MFSPNKKLLDAKLICWLLLYINTSSSSSSSSWWASSLPEFYKKKNAVTTRSLESSLFLRGCCIAISAIWAKNEMKYIVSWCFTDYRTVINIFMKHNTNTYITIFLHYNFSQMYFLSLISYIEMSFLEYGGWTSNTAVLHLYSDDSTRRVSYPSKRWCLNDKRSRR